jgi:hypothetical protein
MTVGTAACHISLTYLSPTYHPLRPLRSVSGVVTTMEEVNSLFDQFETRFCGQIPGLGEQATLHPNSHSRHLVHNSSSGRNAVLLMSCIVLARTQRVLTVASALPWLPRKPF